MNSDHISSKYAFQRPVEILLLALLTLAWIALPSGSHGQEAIPASAPELRKISGEIWIWKRDNCSLGKLENESSPCGLPKEIAPPWAVDLSFHVPSDIGQHVVAQHEFANEEWTISLMLVWVHKKDEEPYLVTQTRLTRKGSGIVAECSRYDASDAFSFLPPGSCAGRDQGTLYGISLIGQPRSKRED